MVGTTGSDGDDANAASFSLSTDTEFFLPERDIGLPCCLGGFVVVFAFVVVAGFVGFIASAFGFVVSLLCCGVGSAGSGVPCGGLGSDGCGSWVCGGEPGVPCGTITCGGAACGVACGGVSCGAAVCGVA